MFDTTQCDIRAPNERIALDWVAECFKVCQVQRISHARPFFDVFVTSLP